MHLFHVMYAFLYRVIQYWRMPFSVYHDRPNKETVSAIAEVRRMKQNPSLGKTYTDVDEMMKELLA